MSSQPENTDVARSARRLRWAVIVAALLMVLAYGLARFDLQPGQVHVEHYAHGLPRGVEWLVSDGAMLLLLGALVQLCLMLGRVGRGELFSAAVIRHFRGFALWLLLMALFRWFAPIVAGFAEGRPDGVHQLQIRFDFEEILTVGLTLLLFLLARLLERARRLDEEVREFV